MYVEKAIHPVQTISLRNDSAQMNQYKEAFQDILQRQLNNKSNSRPPKVELKGTLVPCNERVRGGLFKYKLETDSKEYLLRMNSVTALIAKKLEWDEVAVTGYINVESDIIDVERIKLTQTNEQFKAPLYTEGTDFDYEDYKSTIARRGKLDLALDYLAS